ncbi:MAG: SGNH/GDSL hydrolase family protein [Burkholderiaceae bacterium]
MRRWLPELIAAPMLPLLAAQGRRVRRITPRLPCAEGPGFGICEDALGGPPLRLLAVGESPVAGVGVEHHEQAITAALARELARRLARPVHWRACGLNGATVRQAQDQLLPLVPAQPVDVLLVAFGVNDSTAFHSTRRWQADLTLLLESLRARCQPGMVLLAGVPPLAQFPGLPQPLRWVLGLKAAALDHVAAGLPGVRHVPMRHHQGLSGMMASDNYHPSALGCDAWARDLAHAAQLSLRQARAA